MQRIDLTGKRFGDLIVIKYDKNGKWLCICDCGNETYVASGNLNNGFTKSCGCKRTNVFKDLTGKQFGFLTAVEYVQAKKPPKWLCRCICGKEIVVITDNLTRGHTKSCGCKKGKMITNSKMRHGQADSKAYNAWRHIKGRCLNPKDKRYEYYGGRGIKVCDRWLETFENFYFDMGDPPTPQHSIDRINVDGDYEPSNCRWATVKEQMNNTRQTPKYTYQNESHTLKEWAEIKNITYSTLQQRIKKMGWTIEKSIETPKRI